MNKLLPLLFIALSFASCDKAKIENLNNRIIKLQQDSIKIAVENKLLVDRLDSLKTVEIKRKQRERILNCGNNLITLAAELKEYYNYRDNEKSIFATKQAIKNSADSIKSEIGKSYPDILKQLNQADHVFEMYLPRNANEQMAAMLWLDLYRRDAIDIKNDLAKIEN